MPRRELGPLLGLAAILAITASWWALALWPLPAQAPEWLTRTRLVCFGAARDTLPTAAGWTLLIGEPLAMLAALLTIWPHGLRAGLRRLASSATGRSVIAATIALVAVGLGAAATRVWATPGGASVEGVRVPADTSGQGRAAPPLGLVDQYGNAVTLERFRGRPLLVVFAFAHCQTVCPLIVHDALAAQHAATPRPAVLAVTLDPWRDTPSRLPSIAARWNLGSDAWVASGTVAAVEATLDAWGVARARDPGTGDLAHPSLIVVVDAAGIVRARVPGDTARVLAALRRVRAGTADRT